MGSFTKFEFYSKTVFFYERIFHEKTFLDSFEENRFENVITSKKSIKLGFHQHWDSWDWNFENLENNFDFVDVELF